MNTKTIYNKVEFWIITTIAISFIFSLLVMSKNADAHGSYWFSVYHIRFNFYKHLFLPGIAQVLIFYGGFLSLNYLTEERKDPWTKAGSVFGVYLVVATLLAITYTYWDGWKFAKYADKGAMYDDVFIDAFTTVAILFLCYIAYYILKQGIISFASRQHVMSPKRRSNLFKILLATLCWLTVIPLLANTHAGQPVIAFWIAGIPYAATIVMLHIKYLIPLAEKKGFKSRGYIWRVLPLVFLLAALTALICSGIAGNSEFGGFFAFLLFITFILIIPVSWYISKNRIDKQQLQTALGSSQANLYFLRSQINPHFLFNSLNTLYGTALQENADRTGEGIQKLGDMMRFMLHENVQEKISLAREVDYLNNYVDLQKLRTVTSPNIVIQTNIEEQLSRLDISPMLLIPFVENAFKHGISLQQPSFINVSLHTKQHVLYLDVHNSVHLKSDHDPEKLKSGIGLQNVKQRLQLLYPNKHELIIRESAKEFFVHLTITL